MSANLDLVELAGRQLEAANRHDLNAFMSVFAPDAVYDASRDGLGVYEGPAAIRGLIGGWWDAFDDLRLTPEEVLDLGNGVLFAAIRHDARPVGSAAYVNTHQAYVFVIVEGLVARTTVYRDIDEARAAAERLAAERGQTMSDEPLVVTRSWFETWNRGDLDAFVDLYAVDAEMTPPPSWVETETLKGQSAIRRFFEGLKEAWEGEDTAVLLELLTAGDKVVSRMDWQVRGRASGIDTHLGITNVNTIERGKIIQQRHYLDHAEALKAVGLAE